ncbi:hypothetical protein FHS29_000318 [Saccharothrix tamanrassetensis]|uniref:Uncharacterized protein n=1 Tax=Saccharothrix tamanrassetensis TaxID=1051531 RepID=A0A841CC47_9PSEU|nr:hypothetical protein [Saccharothrix tamanrassetensis]MBB5953748.1 hypothetical protein [Saccharothrix tamanrassetensis]
MTHPSQPRRGAIVTYLNPNVLDPVVFAHGLITGPHVVDPETHRNWVPVLRPDHSTVVLDTANIVEVLPSRDDRAEPGTAA